MKEKLMHKYALSSQGAKDMIKAFISVTISDLILMIPVSLLYFLVKDYTEGNLAGRGGFYIAGVIITLALIAVSTYIQYNATFLSTYVESGVRRITLAEKLRKIPLSFFGKKDLSDLTSTIMADCAQMETASSHFIPELVGACISTAFVAIGLFFFDWRMAIAALWVLPISFIIVSCSGKVQRKLNEKQVALKITCADGIQECLESVRDIRAYNTQEEYMKGLDEKIKAVEKHAVATELGTAVFVGSAQMIRFIQRDEITHLLIFQNMINSVQKERPELFTAELKAKVYDMFQKAGELEIEWGKYITQNQIMGFTDDIIETYIHYLIDDRLTAVGFEKLYNANHPIKWVDDFSKFNDQKTNFFEGNVSNYSKGSLSFDDF